MHKEMEYRERCRVRGLDDAGIDAAVAAAEALEADTMARDGKTGSISLAAVEPHVASLMARVATQTTLARTPAAGCSEGVGRPPGGSAWYTDR